MLYWAFFRRSLIDFAFPFFPLLSLPWEVLFIDLILAPYLALNLSFFSWNSIIETKNYRARKTNNKNLVLQFLLVTTCSLLAMSGDVTKNWLGLRKTSVSWKSFPSQTSSILFLVYHCSSPSSEYIDQFVCELIFLSRDLVCGTHWTLYHTFSPIQPFGPFQRITLLC